MKYLIFSFLRSGVNAKGGVNFRHLTKIRRKVGNGVSNIKYLIFSSGNRTYNLSCLHSHACAPVVQFISNIFKSEMINKSYIIKNINSYKGDYESLKLYFIQYIFLYSYFSRVEF